MANSKVVQHGTRKRYQKGCRCDACRAAEVEYTRRYRQARDTTAVDFPHGTHTGYACGCRCERCVSFKRGYAESVTREYDYNAASYPHGTHRGYVNGCHCDACLSEEYLYRRALNENRDFLAKDFPHGLVKGYKRGCRCEYCRTAKSNHDSAVHHYKMQSDSAYVGRRRQAGRVTTAKRRGVKALLTVQKDVMDLIYKLCPAGYQVDHIVPLSKGGEHSPGNVQYLPATINQRKGSKLDYDVTAHVIRWQDILDRPSTTIPGAEVDPSGSKCSTASWAEDIVCSLLKDRAVADSDGPSVTTSVEHNG